MVDPKLIADRFSATHIRLPVRGIVGEHDRVTSFASIPACATGFNPLYIQKIIVPPKILRAVVLQGKEFVLVGYFRGKSLVFQLNGNGLPVFKNNNINII